MDLGPSETRLGSSAPAVSIAFTPGTVLADRYRIVALAGRGGMGEVYRADDLRLGQTVAGIARLRGVRDHRRPAPQSAFPAGTLEP